MNFQLISWAQFAVFDAFDDSTKRDASDPSTYPARVYLSQLDNGGDGTPDREFGYVSKTYNSMQRVDTGNSTSVGLNFLTDTSKAWFTDERKNLTLYDGIGTPFNVESNTATTLTVVGSPTAGAYVLDDAAPTVAVAFAHYLDATNGGSGNVKMEVSFDGGVNYQTFLDTGGSIDETEGTVAIVDPGTQYVVRLTLTNDGDGNGPLFYSFLVCTDPSPWRF